MPAVDQRSVNIILSLEVDFFFSFLRICTTLVEFLHMTAKHIVLTGNYQRRDELTLLHLFLFLLATA